MKRLNLSGKRFGSLTVIRLDSSGHMSKWLCRCDCGHADCLKTTIVFGTNLTRGNTLGCGYSSAFKNISGQTFGRWTVLRRIVSREHPDRQAYWLCRCECQNTSVVSSAALRSGRSISCGCSRKRFELPIDERYPHIHGIWTAMKARCYNPNTDGYKLYGARGIRVCKRWHVFKNFVEDMKAYPGPGFSIDRINNDGNYEPGNCRWATRKEQARNTRANRRITIDGVTKSLVEWSETSSIQYHTIKARIYNGWSPKDAVFAPLRGANA